MDQNSSSGSYTSDAGSSFESWEEESYVEIMDEVTGRFGFHKIFNF